MKQGITLGLYMGWLWSLYLNGPILHSVALSIPIEHISLGFILCHSLALLAISCHDYTTYRLFSRPGIFYSAGAVTSIGSIFPAYIHLFPHLAIPITAISVLVASIGSAILLVSCGVLFCQLPIRNASINFAVAVILGTVLFFGTTILISAIIVLAFAMIPLVLARQLVLSHTSLLNTLTAPKLAPCHLPTRLKILLAIIFTAGGLMHKSIDFYSPSPIVESYWLTNIIYCLTCIVCGSIIYKIPDIDLRLIYRPVVPLLAAGFILFPLLSSGSNIILAFTFLQTGFALFDIYTWLLFIYLASHNNCPQKIIAQGMFYTTLFVFFGEFLFTQFSPVVLLIEAQLPTIMFTAAIVLLLATLVFRDERESFSGWRSLSKVDGTVITDKSLDASIAAPVCHLDMNSHTLSRKTVFQYLTANYRLTQREEEIVLLLAKGRNNPFISEHLNISSNTLKSHLRNLYHKCGVTNRQELLSLIEQKNTKTTCE